MLSIAELIEPTASEVAFLLPGEIIALTGPSGAGKSTLLHIAGLLERPDAGEVTVNGRNCGQLNDLDRTAMRRSELGFVYQFHHLGITYITGQNVKLTPITMQIYFEEVRL